MRKVKLRMNENIKYEVIKKLVDTDGNKKHAAIKLGCSSRTINRLIITYKTKGKAGFVHGNRNRLPATTFPLDIKKKVIKLYVEDFSNANLTHFCEIIRDDLHLHISDTTINKWLREENVLSPKARKKTKKAVKQLLHTKLADTSSKALSNAIKESIAIIEDTSAHPRRPRCKYAGEMIQMDASSYEWINGEIWHLHLAIDDATNEVVGAYFDTQETLKGYYHVFYQILSNHGIPSMFYTDRRTVFEYKRKNNAFDDEDTFTQFAYACHQLGVAMKTTSVAQAKGRIERLNQTFQSRLPVELKRHPIHCIEDANEFLKSYLKKFNEQFSLPLNTTKSVYERQPNKEKINCTLAVLSPRKIDAAHSIKYKNKYYLPKSSKNSPFYFKNKTDCMVIEAFDGGLYVNIMDSLYAMDEIAEHEKYSKEFDTKVETKKKEQYIPAMDHPWRTGDFLGFLAKQKHREGANV